MDTGIIDLPIWQTALSFVYVIIVLAIVRQMGIPREMQIIVASFRMTVQLIIAGYVLIFIFRSESIWLIVAALAVMESFAIYNGIKRSHVPMSGTMKRILAAALLVGTLTSLAWFLLAVVQGDSWRTAQYVIPLAGMMIGNSMTGVTLAANRLIDGVQTQRATVETVLMLGGTPRRSTRDIVRKTFDAAILPTINSMVGMGIVALPGMMTGQILSGVSPLIAIKYQIAIMLGILGAVAITVLIFVEWGYRQFFNRDSQLVSAGGEG